MQIEYIRSSSYNCYDFCQLQYYMNWVLGMPSEANKKADKGTITHKALELLAKRKLAEQNKQEKVLDNELGPLRIDDMSPETCLRLSFNIYEGIHTFDETDREDCLKYIYEALNHNSGMFSPLKRTIIVPEQYFEIEVKQEWAKLDAGDYLKIRGTLDLVVEVDSDTIELIDWKTGKRFNWNKGKVKEFDDFHNDPQLLIYFYAMKYLWPEKKCLVTIFYLQDGGPISVCFQNNDVERCEKLLEKRFTEIKKNKKPKNIWGDWKCRALCHYGKTTVPGTKFTQCETVKHQLMELGMDKVTKKLRDSKKVNSYEGGGANR